MTLKGFFSSLYWRISFIFLLMLIIMASAYVYITLDTAELYFQESSQKLNHSVAEHIAHETHPIINGEVNDSALHHLFHNIMVHNPSLEVYLLDTEGTILSYFAPKSKVKLNSVGLAPIQRFIEESPTPSSCIVGDDPRNPDLKKAFSAAEIIEDGQHLGYIYVVLASEEYTSVTQMLLSSYRLQLAGKTMLITMIMALVIGLVILWFLTRNLNKIMDAVNRFRKGDHNARVNLKSRGELTQLADNFNSMADTIVKYIHEIKSVEELRRELIANVSHDLRTPLAAIQGYAETLVMKSETLDSKDRVRYTETILKGTQRIKKLVDDLFELSKLETRQIQTHFEFFSLAELMHDIAHKYELLAHKQGIVINTNIPQNLPMTYGDIALIDRVLQNLMDNALKNTPEQGSISIEVSPGTDGLQVIVADTGLGIKEDELPYIFDRYRKGKQQKKEGTGLGLAIVKKILEMHQTTISVKSKVNQGTSFVFRLPTEALTN